MDYQRLTAAGALTLALVAGGCNRPANEASTPAGEPAATADVAADRAKEHSDDVAQLDKRVADLEREYDEANAKVVSGTKAATAGLREEVKEDVTNVRRAVSDLQSTTPDNWWERHEQAMRRTAEDIEADVRRLGGNGNQATPRPQATTGRTSEGASTAPFTSRRDALVADLRARVDAMERSLQNVKARDAADTELDDTKARLEKLGDDLDRLASASADDWWDISKTRVTEYVDRVESSVKRLDDNSR